MSIHGNRSTASNSRTASPRQKYRRLPRTSPKGFGDLQQRRSDPLFPLENDNHPITTPAPPMGRPPVNDRNGPKTVASIPWFGVYWPDPMQLNIHAGTQVVSRVEVRGANGSMVHPRGAVGVVTRTPTKGECHFLVRFPDGFEMSLDREQLEVLKHFQSRLGSGTEGSIDSPGFELESLVIFQCVVGSRAYGLDGDDSDTDSRGVYVAPANLQWSLFGVPEQFEDDRLQCCHWEIQKFLVMALKANPNVLECLYSPIVKVSTPLGEELLGLRGQFLSQMIFQTFNGYALSQFRKIEQDLRNQGSIRWKHAMHLLRLLITGAAALREARVPVRVEAHRERLLAVKRGEVPWQDIDAWRRDLHSDFDRALEATVLPERPDYEAANRFLVSVRSKMADRQMRGFAGVPR